MARELEVLLVDDNPSDAELTIHSLRRDKLANRIHVAEDARRRSISSFAGARSAIVRSPSRPGWSCSISSCPR
jgi:hypothetical protein